MKRGKRETSHSSGEPGCSHAPGVSRRLRDAALRVRWLPPRAFVAAALLVVVALLFLPQLAQAQADEVTLVDNTDFGGDTVGFTNQLSQRFNTGSNPGGYKLTKVIVVYEDRGGDKFAVRVCTVTGSDQPTSTCTNFTAPTGSFSVGDIEFTHSTGMDLLQGTKYAVVVTPESGKTVDFNIIGSDNEHDKLPGWNIAGELRTLTGGTWVAEERSRALTSNSRAPSRKATTRPPVGPRSPARRGRAER